jgi:arsenate reductase
VKVCLGLFDLAANKVLFICVHNSARSQMAEAFFNKLVKGKVVATSAGTQAAAQVHPTVVAAMREIGMEIGEQKPKLLTSDMPESGDRVIAMGCNTAEVCPASFVPTDDRELDEPQGKPIEEVRQIRDKIKARVEGLLEGLL